MDSDAARAAGARPGVALCDRGVARPAAECVGLYDRDLAISPDGRHLVYRAGGGPPTIGTAADGARDRPARRPPTRRHLRPGSVLFSG